MGTPEENDLFASLISDSEITLAENKAAYYKMGVVLGSLFASLRVQGVPEHVAQAVIQTACAQVIQGTTTSS